MSLRIFDEKLEEECINIGTKYLKLYLNLNKVTTNLTNQLVKYIKKQYLRGTQRKISDGEIEEIIRSLQKGVKVRDKNKIRRKMHNLVARAIQWLDYRLAKNGLIQPKEIRFSASCTKDIRLKWFKLRFNGCELPDSLKALQAPEMNNGSDEEHHVSPNQGSSTPPDESEDHPAEEPSNQVSSTPIEESEAEHHVISPNQVSSTPAVVSSKRRAQQPEKRATPHDHTRSVSSVPSNKRTSSDAGFNTHNSNRVLRRKRMKIGGKTASCNNAVESFFAPTATGRTGSWVCKVGTSFDEASLPLEIARYIETDADIHFSYVTEPSTSAFANAWSKLHELINEFKSAESDLHVVCIQAGKDSPITYFMEQFCITDEVIEWYVEHMKSTRKKRIHNQEGFDTFGGKHKRNTPGRYYVRDAFQPDIMKEFEDKDMLSDNKIQNFIAFETYVRNAIQIMFARHGYHLNLEQVLTDRSSPRSELATQYSLDLLWSEPRLVTQDLHTDGIAHCSGTSRVKQVSLLINLASVPRIVNFRQSDGSDVRITLDARGGFVFFSQLVSHQGDENNNDFNIYCFFTHLDHPIEGECVRIEGYQDWKTVDTDNSVSAFHSMRCLHHIEKGYRLKWSEISYNTK